MNIEEIYPKVYFINFDNRQELCKTFLRIQEYYESPVFHNKIFTLNEFRNYWVKTFGNGIFDYYDVWGGFNVPYKTVNRWEKQFRAKYHKLIPREEKLLSAIKKFNKKQGHDDNYLKKSYIVATFNNQKSVIDHEVSHAFYYLDPMYKKDCVKLLSKIPKNILVLYRKTLYKKGYGKSTINDELQAYFSVESKSQLIYPRKEFIDNFKKHKRRLKCRT